MSGVSNGGKNPAAAVREPDQPIPDVLGGPAAWVERPVTTPENAGVRSLDGRGDPKPYYHFARLPEPEKQILDACCGGRFWWWDKQHPLAIYVDNRVAPPGSRPDRPNWSVEPDVVADFRELPFEDQAFRLVLFDPPHIAREQPSGNIANQFGALAKSTEQEDLRRGFTECWRVLAEGGTLVFKWAGALERVTPHFPDDPIVSTRTLRRGSGLGTRWFIFYKAIA